MDRNENSLISRLEKGINTKIILFSHNSYWSYLQKISRICDNCKTDIFGRGTDYVPKYYLLEECDFIIFYSSDFFDEDELYRLKEMALSVSNKENKRVSIGYSYIIPMEDRQDKDAKEEIRMISFKNREEYEETFNTKGVLLSDLMNLTIMKHDELENQKIIKKCQ